jgi:hypothetical protein
MPDPFGPVPVPPIPAEPAPPVSAPSTQSSEKGPILLPSSVTSSTTPLPTDSSQKTQRQTQWSIGLHFGVALSPQTAWLDLFIPRNYHIHHSIRNDRDFNLTLNQIIQAGAQNKRPGFGSVWSDQCGKIILFRTD